MRRTKPTEVDNPLRVRALRVREDSADCSGQNTAEPDTLNASGHYRLADNEHRTSARTYRIRCRRPAETSGFRLTSTIFDSLLLSLDPDRDTAGQEYERIRAKLLRFFECRGCETPEDLTDETIDRVAAKIAAGAQIRCSDAASYFYGVARFVAREYWRIATRRPISLDVSSQENSSRASSTTTERPAERRGLDRQLECLESALESLGPKARRVLLAYYEGENGTTIKSRATLAESLGLQTGALRTSVHRMREKVRAQFEVICSTADQ
jgi:RNA polymerase sigma factor (sigma-70 family)